jgi:zinc transport system substrate-binding protein
LNHSRAALTAIAVVIPLAMVATAYRGRPPKVSQEHEKITVVASFYPLYEFASRVGGDRADVSSLVPAGIDPHDWEPTLQDIEEDGQGDEGGVNPHIWLDPVLAKHQVEKIRNALAIADPKNTNYYAQNAAEFTVELDQLDAFIRLELGDCEKSNFIAFHDAFAYFAERYGLTRHSIHDVSPEGEILPQRMQEIIELGINVDYSEDLIDSRLADTIAGEIPAGRVLMLRPIEGIDQEDRALGIAYIEKMKQNVETLKVGLECAY